MALPTAAFAGSKGGGHASGGNKPSESISQNYGKIEQTYTKQSTSKKTGTTKGKTQPYLKYELRDVGVSSYQ